LVDSSKKLWDIFLESILSKYGIGGNRFKNPNTWALLNKIDEILGDARNKVVFDVGCGTGIKSILMALKGARVKAFDVDPRAIANCRKNLMKISEKVDIEFFVKDIHDWVADYRGKVDFVFCNQVIEHIQEYRSALNAMAEVLKPNGIMFITTPNKLTHAPKGSQKVFGEELGHHHAFTREDLRREIESWKRLKIKELTTHGPMPKRKERLVYKVVSKINEFQWFLKLVGGRIGTTALEKIYVALTAPLSAVHNSLVYPSLQESYQKGEAKNRGDDGLAIHLVVEKL